MNQDDFNSFKKSTTLVLAVIVLALVYLLWTHFNKPERYLGSGLGTQVYTSGATLRRLGQKFSATNQGVYTTVHNAELSEDSPVPVVIFPADKVPSHLIAY